MITTLMMLLGLSGAGAGLYNVIKKPGEGEEDPGQTPSGRRRRSRSQTNTDEDVPSRSPNRTERNEPSPNWGGRGKELPFQTSKSEDGKLPRGDARPLSEGGPDLGDWTKEEETTEPNKKPPRRKREKAEDKEQAPSLEDIPLGEFGDSPNEGESSSSKPRNQTDRPEISFPVDDIISKNSKYSFHRRPLINAEALIEKDNLEEAIEILQRTGDRIPDPEIKNKIQKNISDIEDFIESQPAPESGDAGGSEKSADGKQEPNKRPLGDIPSKSGDTGFEDFVSALRQVAEVFADAVANAMQYARDNKPPGEGLPASPQLPSGLDTAPSPRESLPPSNQSAPPSLPPPGNVGADFLHPVIYQFLKDAPPLPGYAGLDTKEEKQNYENLIKSLNQGLMSPPNAQFPQVPQIGGGGVPGVVGPFYLPNPDQLTSGLDSLAESLNKAKDGADNFADIANKLEQAKGDIQNKDISDLDLPEDTFFSDEWKEFRGLPLVDRRVGGERRKNADRRDNKSGRKDRRSGEDRRKIDRFKERESYLKDKALQKLEESAKKAQSLASPSLNDLLKPYFPPMPERLNLPDPKDRRERLPEEEEKPKEEEWIEGDDDWFDKTTEALKKEVSLPEPIDPRAPITSDAPLIGLPDPLDPAKAKAETIIETDDPIQVELMARAQEETMKIGLPDPEDAFRDRIVKKEEEDREEPDLDEEPPEIELIDGELGEIAEAKDTPDEMANKMEEEPEKIIHGVLELKPPEADDAPFLTLTYDFGKIPHAFRLSKNYSIMEYSYYKYKPMLMKAQEFARRKMLKNALNYYRVIKSQNIPPELRKMINRNIRDITEFMEKFLMAKGG